MSKGVTYFLGILTGIVLTIGAAFIINKATSSENEAISMFDERGEMMQETAYRIIQTYDDAHALAIGTEDIASMLTPVLVLGDENTHFYDGFEVKTSGNKRFYQVGTYRYQTKNEDWKTVPVVKLLDRK